MNSAKRIEEIDIVKALGIICMVAAHAGAPFGHFVELFHMVIFFIASGFVFKDYNSDSIKNVWKFIKRKIKLLWFPYFVANAVFTLLNNFFIDINVYTNNEGIYNYLSGSFIATKYYMSKKEMLNNILDGILFGGGTTIGGATWFLEILFKVSVLYCIIDFLIKCIFKKRSIILQGIISIVLLMIGYTLSLYGVSFHGLAKTASCYIMYYFGVVFFEYRIKIEKTYSNRVLMIVLLSFICLLVLNNYGSIILASNKYENPVYFIAVSLLGWFLLYGLSYLIKSTFLKNIFVCIGQKTLSIMILHFLSMKIVALIICFVYKLPLFCIAGFPHVYGDKGLWWILYTIVGVFIPLLLNLFKNKILISLSK